MTDVALGLEVGAVIGISGAAFGVGYAFGTWLNNTFGLSDSLLDFLAFD